MRLGLASGAVCSGESGHSYGQVFGHAADAFAREGGLLGGVWNRKLNIDDLSKAIDYICVDGLIDSNFLFVRLIDLNNMSPYI